MVFSTLRSEFERPMFPESRKRFFRSSSAASEASEKSLTAQRSLQDIAATTAPQNDGADLDELNASLRILAAIFPNVRPDVFREMLGTFSKESRLHIVAEQLIKHSGQWVNGRWRVSPRGTGSNILKEVFEVEQTSEETNTNRELVPKEETFRSDNYKRAVRTALSQEFKTLSRSTVDGVLAEQNYSYTLSRPILQAVAAKSWRTSLNTSFNTLLSKWRKPNSSTVVRDGHYMLIGSKASLRGLLDLPTLRPTSSTELDEELYETILRPVVEKHRDTQDMISLELAVLLNEQEAESADSTFECECCFSDATFESIATCSSGTHVICFRCIQHAVSEALFGQSWKLNIDHARSQIACIAPSSTPCHGCIPQHLSHRAVLQTKGGEQTWCKLQSRLSSDSLLASGLNFTSCPFCSYAELSDVYLPPDTTNLRLNTSSPFTTLLLMLLAGLILPFILPHYCFLSLLLPSYFPSPLTLFRSSVQSLTLRTHLPARFFCLNPGCLRPSCRLCAAPWRDPHVCFESASLSLRTTVEAARTAALKRTCPRCGTAFVKESGCNKMVCVCGYSMCYICRQGLGRKSPSNGGAVVGPAPRGGLFDLAGMMGADGEDGEEGEGYRHFCQHFRPQGGRCVECERCDLYRGEDEDEVVLQAGRKAEGLWRERQGKDLTGVKVEMAGKNEGGEQSRGGLQGCVDWWVLRVLRC